MIKISEFTDITYTVTDQVAVITINRPDRYNALRGRTVDELIYAFRYAYVDKGVAAIILTGAGTKAFCSGGDQKERNETGGYGETEMGMFEMSACLVWRVTPRQSSLRSMALRLGQVFRWLWPRHLPQAPPSLVRWDRE